ncbi:MAG: MFS transporter [Candidatus Hodarchaeota archaeon]
MVPETIKIIPPPLHTLKKEANTLFYVTALMHVASGASTIVLPLLLWRTGNISASQIGIIQIVHTITAMFTASFFGSLSDRIGRKPLIVFGPIVIGLSFLPYIFTENFSILIAAGVIRGCGSSMTSGPSTAFVADVSPTSTRGEMMGKLSIANLGGSAIGFVIGGFLWDYWEKDALIVFTGITLACAILLIVFLKEIRQPFMIVPIKTALERNPFMEVFEALRDSQFRRFAAIWFSTACLSGIVITYSPILLDSLTGSTSGNGTEAKTGSIVGTLFLLGGLLTGSTQVLWGKMSDNLGRKPFLLLGATSLATLVSMLSIVINEESTTIRAYFKNPIDINKHLTIPLPFGDYQVSFLVFSLVLGAMFLSMSSMFPASAALLADVAPRETRGTAMGIYKSLLGVGNLTGVLIGGMAIDFLGKENAPLAIVTLCLALAIVNLGTVIFYIIETAHIEEIFYGRTS